MTGLAAQYGDPASSTFVTNFTVIYLRFVVTSRAPIGGVKTAPSEMFREQFWPRNRPF